jgi:hypothetical protein
MLVFFLCGMAAINLFLYWRARDLALSGSNDFMHLWVAGRMTRLGQGAQLYDSSSQFAMQSEYSRFVRSAGAPYPYLRPAFEALLFVPFSYLPLQTAYLLWTAVNLLMLVVTWGRIAPAVPALRSLSVYFWLLTCLAFFPVVAALMQGQDDILLLLLFTLAFLALRRQDDVWAGAWMGLALFRPQFAIPLICFVACSRRLKFVFGVTLAGIGLMGLTVGVYGWRMLLYYPHTLRSAEQTLNHDQNFVSHMSNLHGLFSTFLVGRLPPSAISLLVVAISAVLFIVAVFNYAKHDRDSLDMAFSSAVLTAILVSYHAFAPDFSLLLLPVLLQANWLVTECRPPSLRWVLLISALALFLTPIYCLLIFHGLFSLYALVLVVWLAGSLRACRIQRHSLV